MRSKANVAACYNIVTLRQTVNYYNIRVLVSNFFRGGRHFSIEPRHEISNSVILTSVDSDEPLQPLVKLRNSKSCSVSSLIVIEYSRDKQRL